MFNIQDARCHEPRLQDFVDQFAGVFLPCCTTSSWDSLRDVIIGSGAAGLMQSMPLAILTMKKELHTCSSVPIVTMRGTRLWDKQKSREWSNIEKTHRKRSWSAESYCMFSNREGLGTSL